LHLAALTAAGDDIERLRVGAIQGGAMSLDMSNAGRPRTGLVTGGQPSEADLGRLAAEGVTTVIDLRTDGEPRGYDEPAAAAAAGLRYLSVPVAGPRGLGKETAAALHAALSSAEGGVLVHCASSNRVGALLALAAVYHDGVSVEDALALGRAGGMVQIEPYVRHLLGG
jgi:uncharacterized protein (TIGR01244 family)